MFVQKYILGKPEKVCGFEFENIWQTFEKIKQRQEDLIITFYKIPHTALTRIPLYTMVENERGTFRRKFLESLYITKSENYNCNLEKGLEINSIWSAVLLKFIQSL